MAFEDTEALLFAATDALVGDTIMVKIPPGDFVARKGFVEYDEALAGGGGFNDRLNTARRLKLSKTYFPSKPDRSVRFQSAKLGPGNFQIAGDVDSDAHNYLFDIQAAGS
jgi:hypothetical protein